MRVTLEVREAKRVGGQVRLRVALAFFNDGPKPFELDKVSVCDEGEVCNHVFTLRTEDGKEVSYGGMMAKRAPPGPDGFIRVEPGATWGVEVDLSNVYAFGKRPGPLQMTFDTANHFSRDD